MCKIKSISELEAMVEDYRSFKALKEELDEQVKALEREMIAYLDENNKLSETGSNFTIKVSTCQRTTLDRKALEEDLGSLAEYDKITQYRRFYCK